MNTTDQTNDKSTQTTMFQGKDFERFDLKKWLQTPREEELIRHVLQKVENFNHNFFIKHGASVTTDGHSLSVASGLCVVLIPKYRISIRFEESQLEKDTMRFFQAIFSNDYAEKTFTCKVDTSMFTECKKTFVEGATFAILRNTAIQSIFDVFEWEYGHHKKEFDNLCNLN